MRHRLVVLLVLAAPAISFAHHSFNATFDPGQVIEIEGTVTRVIWRNPHVRMRIDVGGEEWDIESHSVSILSRMEVGADVIQVGDAIKLAGNPAKRSDTAMFALHALLPSGDEIVFDPSRPRRWAENSVESIDYWVAPDTEGGTGIFRAWSTVLADPDSFPLMEHGFVPTFDIASYPLTDKAREMLADFDPYTDTPTLNCARALPCSAAIRYQRSASASSCSTPLPILYS